MNCRVVIKHKNKSEAERQNLKDELQTSWAVSPIPAEAFQKRSAIQSALAHDRFAETYICGYVSADGRAIFCYQYLDRDETMVWIECEPDGFNFTDCRRIITNGLNAIRSSQPWWEPCRIEQAFFYEEDHGKSFPIVVQKRSWLAFHKWRDIVGSLIMSALTYLASVSFSLTISGQSQAANPWLTQSLYAPLGITLYMALLFLFSWLLAFWRYISKEEAITFVVTE